MKSEIDYPRVKRFLELHLADPAFRAEYQQTPELVLRRCGLDSTPGFIDEIFQTPARTAHQSGHPYYQERSSRLKFIGDIIQCLLHEPNQDRRFHLWRQRQLNRVRAVSHSELFQMLPHISIAFELSQGCSGQCPFCCFATQPLHGVFSATTANRKLWREVLEMSRHIVGPVMRYGLCYYATEPFDNPDYETFVEDFHALNDWWPQLTTAKPLESPARIRNYIRMIGAQPLRSNMVRFSVTSLETLRKVHGEYSAEELDHVSLILNNPESTFKYSPAGRARQLRADWQERGLDRPEKFYLPGTIACVSGFVVNLSARSIRLVAPCSPDEAHPQGLILFDEAGFSDAADFEAQMERMIARNMPDSPRPDTALAFAPAFSLNKDSDGIALSSRFMTRRFPGDANWVALAELIRSGRHTWSEIERIFDDPFLTGYYLKPKVQSLFDCGLLLEKRIPKPQACSEEPVRTKQPRAAE